MGTNRTTTVVRAAVLGLGAMALWALAPGCGGASVGKYCDQVCDCSGCSESEREECSDALDDARKSAEDDGCGSQFDDYLSCINEELECKDSQFSADGCELEQDALGECSPSSGFGANPCEIFAKEIISHYDSCGVSLEPVEEEEGECSDAAAAQASCLRPCVELLPCECIDPEQTDQCNEAALDQYLVCAQDCS